jgi:predicted MFS family arabinose efflux permease
VFSGFMSGAAVAPVGDVNPYKKRLFALGRVMPGLAFGQIAGITLGTLLAGTAVFAATFVAFGVLMVVAWMLVLVKTNPHGQEPLTLMNGMRAYALLLRKPDLLAVVVASATMMFGFSAFIVYQPKWL